MLQWNFGHQHQVFERQRSYKVIQQSKVVLTHCLDAFGCWRPTPKKSYNNPAIITVFKVRTNLGQNLDHVCNMSQFCPIVKDGPQPGPTENSLEDNQWTKSGRNWDKVWSTTWSAICLNFQTCAVCPSPTHGPLIAHLWPTHSPLTAHSLFYGNWNKNNLKRKIYPLFISDFS